MVCLKMYLWMCMLYIQDEKGFCFFLFLKMLVAHGEGNQERQGAGGASNLKGSSNCFTKYARRSIQLVETVSIQ